MQTLTYTVLHEGWHPAYVDRFWHEGRRGVKVHEMPQRAIIAESSLSDPEAREEIAAAAPEMLRDVIRRARTIGEILAGLASVGATDVTVRGGPETCTELPCDECGEPAGQPCEVYCIADQAMPAV